MLAEGDADTALDKLAQAVAQAPDNNDLRFELVKQYIGHGRFAEAAWSSWPTTRAASGRWRSSTS